MIDQIIHTESISQIGDVYIERVDGKPKNLYVIYDEIDWPSVIAIAKGNDYEGFSLLYKLPRPNHNEISVIERTMNGSGGGGRNQIPHDSPLDRQLLAIGFVETKPGFFELQTNEGKILAIMKEGRITVLLKEIYKQVSTHLSTEFTVTGTRVIEKEWDWDVDQTAVQIMTDKMSFEVLGRYGGRIVEGSQTLTGSISLESLGLQPPSPITEPSGFVIYGQNPTELIRRLPSLNGIAIPELEGNMRPNSFSYAGFLGVEEKLLEILAEDNDTVLKAGVTHLLLGTWLAYPIRLRNKGYGNKFDWEGRQFEVHCEAWRGIQQSPFRDNTGSGIDLVVTNTINGHSVSYPGLAADMVMRYGFYEGKGTSYRVEPAQILRVFDFLVKK